MRPGAKQLKTDEENLASWLQDVVDIRRAVDALVDHYVAPTAHLGYVGHSYGATMGGLLAAGERRFRALVLMGGFASLSDAIRHPKRGEAGDAHSAQVMSAMDAERYIGHAAPAALLFQFAQFDRFVTVEQANRYAAAASSPKQVKWYECGHEFNDAVRPAHPDPAVTTNGVLETNAAAPSAPRLFRLSAFCRRCIFSLTAQVGT
jgi:pimeloyl-ACP methyl ester carboxylesterase